MACHLRSYLALFGIIDMAKYGISSNFHPICMIQLVNEKIYCWSITGKYLQVFGIVCLSIEKFKRLSKPVSTQLSLLILWVCNLGTLHCADKCYLYVFVRLSKHCILPNSWPIWLILFRFIIGLLLRSYLGLFGIICNI